MLNSQIKHRKVSDRFRYQALDILALSQHLVSDKARSLSFGKSVFGSMLMSD